MLSELELLPASKKAYAHSTASLLYLECKKSNGRKWCATVHCLLIRFPLLNDLYKWLPTSNTWCGLADYRKDSETFNSPQLCSLTRYSANRPPFIEMIPVSGYSELFEFIPSVTKKVPGVNNKSRELCSRDFCISVSKQVRSVLILPSTLPGNIVKISSFLVFFNFH